MSDFVGIKHHGHVVIQNCNLFNINVFAQLCYVEYYMCDICRVVYMSLWSSGQRELERREVLVLPPRGRVGWSVSLVWAFGESTR